jgi:hypothetical protein
MSPKISTESSSPFEYGRREGGVSEFWRRWQGNRHERIGENGLE